MPMTWDEYDAEREQKEQMSSFLKQAFQDKFVQAKKPMGITRERALDTIAEALDKMGMHAFELHGKTEDAKEKAALEAAMQTLAVVLTGVMTTTAAVHEPLSFAN